MKSLKILFLLLFCELSFNSQAQEITMFPGFFGIEYYQDDNRINKKSFQQLMLTNPSSRDYFTRAKVFNNLSFIALGAEITFVVLMFNSGDINTFTNMAFASIGSAIFSVVFTQNSNFFKKKAILNYNQSLESSSLYLGPTSNGIGLVYNF